MKVLEIYDKKGLDRIIIKNKSITNIMEEFWKKWPLSYRENYDKNLETLELWRVDEHYEGFLGEYSDVHNLIIFKKISSIIHELMHMSARDSKTFKNAFLKSKKENLFEEPLIEGCTEYLSSIALGEKPTSYFFESFTASMLSNIDGFFEPYFGASYDDFIALFPYKKDIVSLMYSLYYYANNYYCVDSYVGKEKDKVVARLRHSISDVINTLISIQLSFNKGHKNNFEYSDKFLSLIKEDNLYDDLHGIWKEYYDYTDSQVRKRILRR